jgi:hypothetical protein
MRQAVRQKDVAVLRPIFYQSGRHFASGIERGGPVRGFFYVTYQKGKAYQVFAVVAAPVRERIFVSVGGGHILNLVKKLFCLDIGDLFLLIIFAIDESGKNFLRE